MKDIIKIKRKIVPFLKGSKVVKAGIFGSYARGDQKKNSDIDILIDIDDNLSLLKIVEIKLRLEKILGKKVDLIEYSTLHPMIKKNALKEEIRII